MVLQEMRVSQNLSQIPGVSLSRIFMGGLLSLVLFSMLRKSRACRKCISLAVSQSLAFTIQHPYSKKNIPCSVRMGYQMKLSEIGEGSIIFTGPPRCTKLASSSVYSGNIKP